MTTLAAILIFALTKAELIDRMRAEPVTQCNGMVRVYGDCPADMRKEYQLPVASFASTICNRLYTSLNAKPEKFPQPAIVISIGDIRTNVTDVIARSSVRDDGSRMTRIKLPAPAYADVEQLRLEIVKAFYWAREGETIDDELAAREYRKTDPALRARELALDVRAWKEGVYTDGRGDEEYLELARSIHTPGEATAEDIRAFASRLFLYPLSFSSPFCGRYTALTFRDAVECVRIDPSVRYVALLKSTEVILYGGGRGERLASAAEAYSEFLRELAKAKLEAGELYRMLDEADAKLKGAIE